MSISGLITKLDALKENLPPTVLLSILLGAAIAVLGLSYAIIETYSSLAKKKPWKGFPLISVRGETPQRSFALYGRETLEKGLKEVRILLSLLSLFRFQPASTYGMKMLTTISNPRYSATATPSK